MGPSGSGKSTLLQCVAGLDRADAGTVWLGDVELGALSERDLDRLRAERIGFIFQSFNLLPELTAWENIVLPLELAGRPANDAVLAPVIEAVGLSDRLHHRPAELSGGQRQRVAFARALATDPQLVVADEPTGSLDSHASAEVLGLLRHSVDALDRTVVMVTHDPAAAAYADRVVFLGDGRIVDELIGPTADSVLARMAATGSVVNR